MNVYEYICFALTRAVEANALSKAEMQDYIGRLGGVLGELEGDGANAVAVEGQARPLSRDIAERLRPLLAPGPMIEGEDDGHVVRPVPRRFGDRVSASNRARQMYAILIGCAHAQRTITYGDLGRLMYPDAPSHVTGPALARTLGCVLHWTRLHDLPTLTALVIDKVTGLPGSGCGIAPADVPTAWRKIFAEDWFAIEPPTEAELVESDYWADRDVA